MVMGTGMVAAFEMHDWLLISISFLTGFIVALAVNIRILVRQLHHIHDHLHDRAEEG